jgi:hypothetical protein
MDAKARKDERRRCECGRKYEPEAAAHKHQKTCSKRCRLRRRARQARERYRAAPLVSRDAACKRKRKARDKRRGEGPAPPRESLPSEVVRAIAHEVAGLSSEGWLGRRDVEQALRRVARQAYRSPMSRAGLGADLPVKSGG